MAVTPRPYNMPWKSRPARRQPRHHLLDRHRSPKLLYEPWQRKNAYLEEVRQVKRPPGDLKWDTSVPTYNTRPVHVQPSSTAQSSDVEASSTPGLGMPVVTPPLSKEGIRDIQRASERNHCTAATRQTALNAWKVNTASGCGSNRACRVKSLARTSCISSII